MHGNGYALVGRTALGTPKSLSWIAPYRCMPELNDGKTRLRYRMMLSNGEVRFSTKTMCFTGRSLAGTA